MPKNKNASYRYRLIDYYLKGGKKWAFESFKNRIGERLCEEFGVEALVTQRTIENDIMLMRKEPPEGFGAPIVRKMKQIYYNDVKYSIHNMPLIASDAKVIQEAVAMLEQFQGLPHSGELMTLLQKIKRQLPFELSERKTDVIFVEQNAQLKGLKWISPLYSNIINQNKITIKYRSFKRKYSKQLTFRPYLLKEFNNRWFLLGFNENKRSNWLLALDRIITIKALHEKFVPIVDLNGHEYFKDVIGVTVPNDGEKQQIILHFSIFRAPYVLTKPLHHSQVVLEQCPEKGATVQIEVIPNKELMSLLLSFGADVEVLSPPALRNEVRMVFEQGQKMYD